MSRGRPIGTNYTQPKVAVMLLFFPPSPTIFFFFFFFFVIQILRAKIYYVTRYIGCIVTTWPQPLVTAL